MRLDRYLVDIGKFDSRQKAQEAIRAGRVMLGGKVVQKPSFEIVDSGLDGDESAADGLESRLAVEISGEGVCLSGWKEASRVFGRMQEGKEWLGLGIVPLMWGLLGGDLLKCCCAMGLSIFAVLM